MFTIHIVVLILRIKSPILPIIIQINCRSLPSQCVYSKFSNFDDWVEFNHWNTDTYMCKVFTMSGASPFSHPPLTICNFDECESDFMRMLRWAGIMVQPQIWVRWNYHIKRTNAWLHKQEFFQTSANFLPNCKAQWFVSSACTVMTFLEQKYWKTRI